MYGRAGACANVGFVTFSEKLVSPYALHYVTSVQFHFFFFFFSVETVTKLASFWVTTNVISVWTSGQTEDQMMFHFKFINTCVQGVRLTWGLEVKVWHFDLWVTDKSTSKVLPWGCFWTTVRTTYRVTVKASFIVHSFLLYITWKEMWTPQYLDPTIKQCFGWRQY